MMQPLSALRVPLLLLAILATAGCATVAKAPDERTQVMNVMQRWRQSLLANDVAGIMSLYSKNFTSEFGGTAEIKEIMAELAGRMAEEDGRINLEDADTVVNGDRASVKPVSIGTRKGAVCRSIYLAKEGGRWLIVEMGRK